VGRSTQTRRSQSRIHAAIDDVGIVKQGDSFQVTALVSLSEGVPLEDVLVQVWTNATKSGKWTPKDMHLEERVSVYKIEPPGTGVFEYILRSRFR